MTERQDILQLIEQAEREEWTELDLSRRELTEVPEEIGRLTTLQTLYLKYNNLRSLPEILARLTNLRTIDLNGNELEEVPEAIRQLTSLQNLSILGNRLTVMPDWLCELECLEDLCLGINHINSLPAEIKRLTNLQCLVVGMNNISEIPTEIEFLKNLKILFFANNNLTTLPDNLYNLSGLEGLVLNGNKITNLSEMLGQIIELKTLDLNSNNIKSLPYSLAQLDNLTKIDLDNNPLDPALQSAYEAGIEPLKGYLRSLSDPAKRANLFEAKLVLVGEGGVGKTTLLKALTGQTPRKNEASTHGVSIEIQALNLPYPGQEDTNIQLNAWDFGGQEVYRATHQFFFSNRSVYLLVWEPRQGAQLSQVEEWLRIIKLRVGEGARVIIVSTHAKSGGRIARIDKPVLERDYGDIIVGFHEVDSLESDQATGEKFGIAKLKGMIADVANSLDHMGMVINRDWLAARDELLQLPEPRITYQQFGAVCAAHGLDELSTRTLARLMHDLGYIVYYGEDEKLQNDVVLQPEWLTKAIGFVLEDKATQEREGILPDDHLRSVWLEHTLKGEPTYEPWLYPFFLRLMEKFDVSYRLESGDASLIAQHVPQVRPNLPWLPEEEPDHDMRRSAIVCEMQETPPGLVPWLIVRTHDYAHEQRGDDGKIHRLHWQKGMFLRYRSHGEAMIELRDRELHLYAEAVWPQYFMNVLQQTVQTLIDGTWPGLKDRYTFSVPCPARLSGKPCTGRFRIDSLNEFLQEGDDTIRCQGCRTRHKIVDLLFGLEEEDSRKQLARIESKIDKGFAELASRIANYVMTIQRSIASESKDGPRMFTVAPADGNWHRPFDKKYRLQLWCEAEGCQHPVYDRDVGLYKFTATREWLQRVAPYANFVAGVLKTLLPVAAPAINVYFGSNTTETWKIEDALDLAKEGSDKLLRDIDVRDHERVRQGVLSEAERSGVLALHSLLRELDPHHQHLGLHRIPTYTGDYLWLCNKHYHDSQPKIPDVIE